MIQAFVPDQLLHRYRRRFPNADLGHVLRAVLLEQLKDAERTDEASRWHTIPARLGRLVGRSGERERTG